MSTKKAKTNGISIANEISAKEYLSLLKECTKKKNKLKAIRIKYNGREYASKKEAHRASELDIMLAAGEINEWQAQPKFQLHAVNNVVIGCYIADFRVVDKAGNEWFEDTKGFPTALFRWKYKHFKAEYPHKDLRIL